jgi:H+/Cl- antiporter ClcA
LRAAPEGVGVASGAPKAPSAPSGPGDILALVRSREYVFLLVLAVVIGVPTSVGAYYFLWLVEHLQTWVFSDLPKALGFHGAPVWWPVLPLPVSGVLVALAIRYLPGRGGHSPADGFKAGGTPLPKELPGILLAGLASIALGAVIGPEAPLIALGAGLPVLAVKLAKRDARAQAVAMIGATGSFAAISALLGSPLLGAFLLMEAIGLGGQTATLVLLPGLLASGIGSLVFIGLGSLTGLGTFSLSIPGLPRFVHPSGVDFGWTLLIGLAAPLLLAGVRWMSLFLRSRVEKRLLALTPLVGLAVGALAVAYGEGTGKSTSDVLFSGQSGFPVLLQHSSSYAVGALVLLVACKSLGYGLSLSSFRGGPTFPALYIGAAGGVALAHLPGFHLVPAVATGIGAVTVAALRLPMTSVLLATLLLGSDGLGAMPLVIVAVAVSYVLTIRLTPQPPEAAGPTAPSTGAAAPSQTRPLP